MQGGRTRFSRKQLQPYVGTPIVNLYDFITNNISTKRKYLDPDSAVGILNGFLSGFAMLEAKNISRGFKSIIYGENQSRSKGAAIVLGGLTSAVSYNIAKDLLKSWFSDDEEDKDPFNEEKIIDSIVSSIMFLGVGRFGQSSSIALLSFIGLLKSLEEKSKDKKKYDKFAKSRFMRYPIDYNYGNIPKFIDTFIPFVGETIVTMNDMVAEAVDNGTELEKQEMEELIASVLTLTNDLVKLSLISKGTQAPWQRYSDTVMNAINKLKKGEKINKYEKEILENMNLLDYVEETFTKTNNRL